MNWHASTGRSMRELLAHLQFRGVIRERSVEPYLGILRALRAKRRVKGVLLDISSGGGGSVPSHDLYAAVKRLDQVKPVFASIGSVGASGGYMAAIGARRVFAYPDSAVGSIGVLSPHLAVQGLLEKLGISVELVHQGRHKDAYAGLRPLTEEERGKAMRLTEASYRGFVEVVAAERHRPTSEIEALATGEVFSGVDAVRLHLVDAIGDRESALEALGREVGVPVAKTVRVAPRRPFLERMMSGQFSGIATGLSESVRDAVEDAIWSGGLR
ncbi:MAG: signal peptide peptidase SppA [Thermoplasmata archaeon]|nr:signal peptide peptidase SppA [Thermoplasmata archaeon]